VFICGSFEERNPVLIRFIFALHNHQPVGNFDNVFEGAYRDAYGPFLDLIEHYPEVPVCLHTSGPLMEWLAERQPDYVKRLRNLVARGQVEILAGPFYEPILTMIPPRDRVGQIRLYKSYLEDMFQTRVRGMWMPERVWEQSLVSDIAEAGIEYTVLDDFHFRQAGVEDQRLFGYYVSEDNGKLIRIFPNSERMRYLAPFENDVGQSQRYFGEVAGQNPDAVIVCADDGEKFGSWPQTHKHCYQDGWLWRFMDMLKSVRSWVRLCTFSQALDETAPVGKIYLPDGSYREMTEWALPAPKLQAYQQVIKEMEHDWRFPRLRQFMRGGFWRNFKVKYPETEEMYARMLEVSERVDGARNGNGSALEEARRELYRAQCNCPWWHGTFGGLYLPHLRHAVYRHLINADNALRNGEPGDGVEHRVGDLNLDGADEVCLENGRLAAYFRPQVGGSLYELDLRPISHNLLATLSRRYETYHDTIREHAHNPGCLHGTQMFKQAGLDQMLQYDRYPRKSLVDHFYEPQVTLADVAAHRERELGDFVTGRYDQEIRRAGDDVVLTLVRSGQAAGTAARVVKEVTLRPGADTLAIRYRLEGLPRDRRLHFAVEFHFAGMPAGADDRYFYCDGRQRAGQLQTLQDLPDADRIGLVDEWLGLDASLALSRRGGIWAFPIQTVSQSEGGFELVHQSTAVLPHWHVEADAQGRWEVTINLKLDTARAEARMLVGSSA
jgi:hypothetical protein